MVSDTTTVCQPTNEQEYHLGERWVARGAARCGTVVELPSPTNKIRKRRASGRRAPTLSSFDSSNDESNSGMATRSRADAKPCYELKHPGIRENVNAFATQT